MNTQIIMTFISKCHLSFEIEINRERTSKRQLHNRNAGKNLADTAPSLQIPRAVFKVTVGQSYPNIIDQQCSNFINKTKYQSKKNVVRNFKESDVYIYKF